MDAVRHAMAGAAASMLAMALLFPLENVRTRLQAQSSPSSPSSSDSISHSASTSTSRQRPSTSSHSPSSPPSSSPSRSASPSLSSSSEPSYRFHGALDCIRQVMQREGLPGLYRGLHTALIGVGFSSAAYFYFYRLLRAVALRRRHGRINMTPVENLLVASLAGVLNVFLTLPIWTIQTRQTLAEKSHHHLSLMETARLIVEKESFSGLYKGLLPSLVLVSNPAIQFLVYEQLVAAFTRHQKRVAARAASTSAPAMTALHFFVLGATAKAVATVLTYPYQVIKCRLQADNNAETSAFAFADVVVEMYEKEGLSSFWRGLDAKFTQTVLNSAVMFAVYESFF